MTANEQRVLRGLNERMQAHSNGVLALFRQAGIYVDKPELTDLRQIQEFNPDVFASVIEFLYPEVYANGDGSSEQSESTSTDATATASAGSGFNWLGLVGGLLSGAGNALGGQSYNTQSAAALQVQMNADQKKAELAQKTTIAYIVGGVVLAAAVAVFIIFKKR